MAAQPKGWRFRLVLAGALLLVFLGAGFAYNRYSQAERMEEYSDRFRLLSSLRREIRPVDVFGGPTVKVPSAANSSPATVT